MIKKTVGTLRHHPDSMEAGKLSPDSIEAGKLSPHIQWKQMSPDSMEAGKLPSDLMEAGKLSPDSIEARKLFRPVNLLAYPKVGGGKS
jgi:hypothetical protein